MLLRATLLFILLSPGFLLTLPPIGRVWMSRKTSVLAILVHAAAFYLLLRFSDSIPLLNRIEGYRNAMGEGCQRDRDCESWRCRFLYGYDKRVCLGKENIFGDPTMPSPPPPSSAEVAT